MLAELDRRVSKLEGIVRASIAAVAASAFAWFHPGNSPVGSKTGLTDHTSPPVKAPRMLTLA
jgi:hypothetical protein